jgi:hypothetical protein
VTIDGKGNPQFSINDMHKLRACVNKRLCGLCGNRLTRDAWFIGGSHCFLLENGAFVDPPSHLMCAEYAIRVCPFLAAPRYGERIDLKKLPADAWGDIAAIGFHDSMPDGQPELFGLGCTRDYGFIADTPMLGVFVVNSWDYVEFWKDGERRNAPDAR